MPGSNSSILLSLLLKRLSDQRGASLVELAITIAAILPGIVAAATLFGTMGVSNADRQIDLAATMLAAPSLIQLDDVVIKNNLGQPTLNPEITAFERKFLLQQSAKRIARSSSTWGTGNPINFCVHLIRVAPEIDASSWSGCRSTIGEEISAASSRSLDCRSTHIPPACTPLLLSLGCSDQLLVLFYQDIPESEITIQDCGLGYPTVGAVIENEDLMPSESIPPGIITLD